MPIVTAAGATLRELAPTSLLDTARHLRDLVLRQRHRGNAVLCPVCSGAFRSFVPFNRRANARCPSCSSLERHRLMVLFLLRATDLFDRPQRVLHIAPEPHLRERLAIVHGEGYVYGDVAQPDHYLDVVQLPFPDGSFDVVLCSHVFEHVVDDRRAVAEVHRVLAAGGWALLDAPVDERRARTYEDPTVTTPRARQLAFKQWDHVRIYGRDYADLLRGGGFDVELDPLEVSSQEADLHGLRLGVDRVYYCRKA